MSGSEFCVCCGSEIPEGRMVCPTCERKAREIYCEDCGRLIITTSGRTKRCKTCSEARKKMLTKERVRRFRKR